MRDALRPYWVVELAANWCLVLSRSSDYSRLGESDPLKSIETHLFGAHMSILALRHIERCIENLEKLCVTFPAELRMRIDSFRKEYSAKEVKDARNALEHEEDRVAGVNLNGRPAYDGDSPLPRITGHKSDDPRLRTIFALDKEYNVRAVIDAALALDEPLRGFASRLYAEAVPSSSR